MRAEGLCQAGPLRSRVGAGEPAFAANVSHLALDGDTPAGRPITPKPSSDARLVSRSYADGLAHTFHWTDAA